MPIRYLCSVRRGASPRPIDDPVYFDEAGEYGWVRIEDVSIGNRVLARTRQRLSELGRSKSVSLGPGELILSIAGSVGKPIITGVKCCIHDGFVYFDGLKLSREFLYYVFLDVFLGGQAYKGLGKFGTQLNLNTDTVGGIRVPVPSSAEQHIIVTSLDRETARIDGLVERKRRLVELLREKRTALISHAVTKGLDADAPMKDSGIEWLGRIPNGWRRVRVKALTSKIGSGKTPLGGSDVYCDSGAVFLRSQNVHDTGLRLDDVVRIPLCVHSQMSGTRVCAKDVLLNITGASIGRCCMVPASLGEANVSQHVCIVRPTSQVLPEYLTYSLEADQTKRQIDVAQVGSSREGLTFDEVGTLWLAQPPLDEQSAIVDYLDQQTSKLDALIDKTERAIELLGEYRTALISAAVTGKIDVRDEVEEGVVA